MSGDFIDIKVVRLPRISNFTDFAPFSVEDDVRVGFVESPLRAGDCDCVIIPGSKATIADMRFLEESGWAEWLRAMSDRVVIAGICGGYQMLGQEISDPGGVEGEPGSARGLGLLPVRTVIRGEKTLSRTTALLDMPPVTAGAEEVRGYEIHMGETSFCHGDACALNEAGAGFGAMLPGGHVWGLYLHGVFENDGFRKAFLDFLGRRKGWGERSGPVSYSAYRAEQFDRLADWLEAGVDMERLMDLAGTSD
jgi:adenosylcobyric acid synthase